MSEQEPRAVETVHPTTSPDWIWWGLLAVSCVVGFAMTIFAPT